MFGPKRRGRIFEAGRITPEENDPDYHACHLALEAKYKGRISSLARLGWRRAVTNLQRTKDGKAKPYQVRDVLRHIDALDLADDFD